MLDLKQFRNTVVSNNSVIEVEGGKSDKNSENSCTSSEFQKNLLLFN